MKRKVFMVFLIGLLVLGVGADAYAKKKKKMTKEEKKAAKLAKQVQKITNILGTDTTWKPTVFKNIRKGMTCPEVKQHFPNLSCGDFIPKAMAGFKGSASEYKFHFLSGRLYAATIVFRPRLFDEKRFTTALYMVVQKKWGKLPESKLQQPKWGNPDYDDVEMKYNKTHWEIKVDLPSYDPGETNAASLDEAGIRTELAALLGPKGNYIPTIISQLSGGMTCDQVNALYPGLYECKPGSSSNFPKVSVSDHPLVAGLNFSFRNERLTYVTIIFHYQISRDFFKNAAFALFQENWGDQARIFPDRELVTVYPKPKGSLTLQYNGNRWQYKVSMEGRKGTTAPAAAAVSSTPQKSIDGLWTLEAARQGKKVESMKGGTLRQLEFAGGKLFMKENGKVVMENFYSRSGNTLYLTAAKGGKAVKQFGSVVSHESNKLILRFAGQAIDMIFKKI
jgi:hypothetical protein